MSVAISLLIALCCVVAKPAVGTDLNLGSHCPTGNACRPATTNAPPVKTSGFVKLQAAITPQPNEAANKGGAEDTSTKPKFLEYPATILSIVGSTLLLLLFLAFLWAAFWELRRRTIIIDPIGVGKDLADKGYTPYAIAQRIAGELATLQRTARLKSRFQEDFELSATQIDFTVPSAGISYRALIRYVRQLTGKFEQRVQGEIVSHQGRIQIQLRTSDGNKTRDDLLVTSEQEIPTLLQKAAVELGQLIAPYMMLNYWLRVEQNDRRFEKTFEGVRWCLANTPADFHHRAYLVCGNALAIQRSFDEAEEKFRMALSLKSNVASAYNALGNLNRARRRFDAATAMYRKAIRCDRSDPFPRGNLGNTWNDRRDYWAALACFRQALRINPRYETAWSGIGYAQWKLGQHDAAERTFARAVDIDPKFGWSYLNWSRLLRSQRRYDEAIEKLRAATEQTPTQSEAYAFWGDILVDAGRFEEANEMYQRATVANPGLANGLAGFAFSLRRQRRYSEAIRAAEEALSINPYNMPAMINLAESLRSLHCYDEAIEKYKEIILRDPYQSAAYVGWGQVLRSRHALRTAASRFESAMRIDPRDVWGLQSLGEIYIQMHRYEAAICSFRKAVEVDYWNSWAKIGWGDALTKLGRLDEALVHYRHAYQRDRRNKLAWRKLVDTLIDLGRRDDAVGEMNNAIKAGGQEQPFFAEAGYLFLRLGRYEEAAKKYEQAACNRPDADILAEWGQSLLGLKEYDSALDTFRRALAVDTWNVNTRRGLADTLTRMDRVGVALRLYSMAHRRAPESVGLLLHWSALLRQEGRRQKGQDEKKRKEFYAQAEAKILQAIDTDEWNTAPLRTHGDLLLELGRPQEALKEFDRALRLDRCDWLAWAGQGDALRACQQPAKAVNSYEGALRLRPHAERLLSGLVECLQELGRHGEAINKLERLLELNPRNKRAQELRNHSLRKIGKLP
jgi:superkiller protein 3